ncbi:MAG TPA: ABC transporter substrate-binding protein [Thermomicrobiales bacterium]|jgi:putative hydroxymethylpyrimidine transport system substrate-binding protein|nr:ABC transporter substrate-binding protein [Thermomicrobiales bacterium]
MTHRTIPTHRRLDARTARLRWPAVLGAAALAAPALMPRRPARAQDAERISLALDWYANANHAGIYLAEAQGLYAAEGVVPEIYVPADPSIVLATVGAGQDDFGISYQTEVLLARAQGVPVVSVAAVVQVPLLTMMALTDRGITRPSDLRGRSIGSSGLASDDAILSTVLAADGVSIDEVEVINVGYDLLPAIASGRVDAVTGVYWNHESLIAEREGYDVTFIQVEDWGVPSYYELVLVASEQTVAERPETVRALIRAMAAGYTAAAADHGAALDALAAGSPELDVELEREGIPLSQSTWFDANGQWGTQTAERWDAYAEWLASNGLIPADLDPAAAWFPGAPGVVSTPVATPAS